jgi:hypothetical protein
MYEDGPEITKARGFRDKDGRFVGRSIAVIFEPRAVADAKAKKNKA